MQFDRRPALSLPRWRALALPLVTLLFSWAAPSQSHPADISHLKVKVEPRRIEFRVTFNLHTLQQFLRIDADKNGKLSKRELSAAEAPLRDYLGSHVLVTINGADSNLGEPRRMERMWLDDDGEIAAGEIAAGDYPQRFVDFTFIKFSQPLVEELWVGFKIFEDAGALHVVQAIFEQDGKPAEISFTRDEPEYAWVTDFADTAATSPEPAAAMGADPTSTKSSVHPVALVTGILALTFTWLLLRKVNRISRGGFRIGPRE